MYFSTGYYGSGAWLHRDGYTKCGETVVFCDGVRTGVFVGYVK